MVARLAARFDTAGFFFFEKVHQLSNRCFFNTELFLARM
jgi:hypothetical protein